MENSFIFEFESWVPLWCVSVDAHSGSHFYNNETSIYDMGMVALLPVVGPDTLR